MPPHTAVVGAGSWGTTVAALLAARGPTALWARSAALAEAVNREHRNPKYLPHIRLPATLTATPPWSRRSMTPIWC